MSNLSGDMLNITIMTPEDLPRESGLIGWVNKHGEIGAFAATDGTYADRLVSRRANKQKAINEGVDSDMWGSTGIDKRAFFVNYPEAIERCVFWPMDFALAEYMRDKFKKNSMVYKYAEKSNMHKIKSEKEQKIVDFLKKIRGWIGGTPLLVVMGESLADRLTGKFSHRGWDQYGILTSLVDRGIVEKHDTHVKGESLYRIARAHRPTLEEQATEEDTDKKYLYEVA